MNNATEQQVTARGITVPDWIEQDITDATLLDIVMGGCASGSYMPAMYYSQATATMSEHGNEVLDYIEQATGERLPDLLQQIARDGDSWQGLQCGILAYAVELWASETLSALGEEV